MDNDVSPLCQSSVEVVLLNQVSVGNDVCLSVDNDACCCLDNDIICCAKNYACSMDNDPCDSGDC